MFPVKDDQADDSLRPSPTPPVEPPEPVDQRAPGPWRAGFWSRGGHVITALRGVALRAPGRTLLVLTGLVSR